MRGVTQGTLAGSPYYGLGVLSYSNMDTRYESKSRTPKKTKEPASGRPRMIAFRNGAAFEAWLDKHVGDSGGVWLKLAKKGSGIPSLTDAEAVDIGLCYGWISGQRKSLDQV